MKIDDKIIDFVKDCDSYYIIVVKGNQNVTLFESNIKGRDNAIHSIVGAMLGKLKELVDEKKAGGNLILAVFISMANKMFPQLR